MSKISFILMCVHFPILKISRKYRRYIKFSLFGTIQPKTYGYQNHANRCPQISVLDKETKCYANKIQTDTKKEIQSPLLFNTKL